MVLIQQKFETLRFVIH